MSTIYIEDSRMTLTITSVAPISVTSNAYHRFVDALVQVNMVDGVASIQYTASDIDGNRYTLNTEHGRSYVALLVPQTRTREIVTGPFTLAELLSHNPVIETLFELIDAGVSQVTVDYA